MKIWIDLSNSPHPLLFAPVARALEHDGHEVLLTARDHAQTVQLARERWPSVEVIGGPSPRERIGKLQAIAARVARLRSWAASKRPAVALSHNSYAQILAARMLGIPAVTAMDFEHQPANHLAFRLADTVVLPDVMPLEAVRRQGARSDKVVRYPGLKEELYVGDFTPDPDILAKVGLPSRPRVLVLARTPPSRAAYHPAANPLFDSALRTLCAQPGLVCVVLTRHPEQLTTVEALPASNCLAPCEPVDSRSLIYAADAMIGAGGTMTREAALIGIPTWSLFAGRQPAVDAWLERAGRLRRLRDAEQLRDLDPRTADPQTPEGLRARARMIQDSIITATLAATGSQ